MLSCSYCRICQGSHGISQDSRIFSSQTICRLTYHPSIIIQPLFLDVLISQALRIICTKHNDVRQILACRQILA